MRMALLDENPRHYTFQDGDVLTCRFSEADGCVLTAVTAEGRRVSFLDVFGRETDGIKLGSNVFVHHVVELIALAANMSVNSLNNSNEERAASYVLRRRA